MQNNNTLSLPEQKKKIRMNKIVRNAKHLFEKKGYYETTISTLCKEVMISRSTFFNYFGSKETIIRMIIEEDIQEFDEHVNRLIEDSSLSPLEFLDVALDFIVIGSSNYKNITGVFYTLAINDPDYKKLISKYIEIEEKIARHAQDMGLINPDISLELIAKLFHGCHSDIVLHYTGDDPLQEFHNSIREVLTIIHA